MDIAPNKLRLVNGKVELADGADATAYLVAFAERLKVTPDTPVCLITQADLDDLLAHRHLALAA